MNTEANTEIVGNLHFFNNAILNGFYGRRKTSLTKDELLAARFDFSEFFPGYDPEHTQFEFKDFVCGNYFVRVKPDSLHRRVFDITRVEYSDSMTRIIKRAYNSLTDRFFSYGTWWAHMFDREMEDPQRAAIYAKRLDENRHLINERILPELKKLQQHLSLTSKKIDELVDGLENEEKSQNRYF